MSKRLLPGILADIEEAAGRQAALGFAHRYGGARLYVGRRSSWLDDLPPDAAAWLRHRAAGDFIEVPTLGRGKRNQNLRALIEPLLAAGLPVREVARRLRVSGRYVQQIKSS